MYYIFFVWGFFHITCFWDSFILLSISALCFKLQIGMSLYWYALFWSSEVSNCDDVYFIFFFFYNNRLLYLFNIVKLYSIFSSRRLMVPALRFKTSMCLKLVLEYSVRNANYPCIFHLIIDISSIISPNWIVLAPMLIIDHINMDLLLERLFSTIDIFVCVFSSSTTILASGFLVIPETT